MMDMIGLILHLQKWSYFTCRITKKADLSSHSKLIVKFIRYYHDTNLNTHTEDMILLYTGGS